MAMGEPIVIVECDSCKEKQEIELTPLAQRSWDMRNVFSKLHIMGWHIHGDATICPDCRQDKKE